MNVYPYEIQWAGSVSAKVRARNIKGWSEQSPVGNGGAILWGPSQPLALTLNSDLTTRFNAAFSWQAPADDRGTVVLDYQVWYDQAVEDWVLLAESLTDLNYVATNLITSYTYYFKVRARNAHDFGDFSEELGILVAEEPVTPGAPVTSLVGANIVVTWSEPENSGQPILGYRVYLKKADGTFNIDFTYCDGEAPATMSERRCEIPAVSFVSELYGLTWGDSVYAKVVAHNVYGDSQESALSNPTLLMTTADAPINLQELTSLRSANAIGMIWEDGASEFGAPVTDYTISIAIGLTSTDFTVLQELVLTKQFTAESLEVGTYY